MIKGTYDEIHERNKKQHDEYKDTPCRHCGGLFTKESKYNVYCPNCNYKIERELKYGGA